LAGSGLHVGWLSREHAFSKGDVAPHLTNKLALLSRERMNEMKGCFFCELCDPGAPPSMTIMVEGNEVLLGNAEIWVPGAGNKTYVAPNLIVHYVRDHQYHPPDEFL